MFSYGFQNRLNKASLAIRNVLRLPDVIGLSEMENLSTLQALATKVNSDVVAGGGASPNYAAYLVEGNDIGGIDVGFLVKSSRITVMSVQQQGLTTTFVDPTDGSVDILNDRPPLVLEARAFRPNGSAFDFTVVVNHLRSLTSIGDPTSGPRVRAKRQAQAEFLANLIQTLQTPTAANPVPRVIAIGDFNAFDVNDGYVDSIGTIVGAPTPPNQVVLASPDLVNPNLTSLLGLLPASERYSYVFDGNAQVLDHALANAGLMPWVSRFAYARLDADFPDTMRNDPNRPERVSDHDASMTYLALGAPRLAGRFVSQAPAPGGRIAVTVEISNTGSGNARNVTLNQFLTKRSAPPLVTAATPLPVVLGDIAPGQAVTVTITVNTAALPSPFAVSEVGTYRDSVGTASNFSMTQVVP